MREHISLDSIDCEDLQYVKTAHTWVCLDAFCDLDDVEFCMRCKFAKAEEKEKFLLEEGKRGTV